jgi:peptidoglycan hydrolase CwlO-like protein
VQVSVWVPIVIALIGAVGGWSGGWFLARSQRATTAAETEVKEIEIALNGLVALVAEMRKTADEHQRERKEYRVEIAQLQAELRSCNQRVREIEQEMIT